LQLGSIAFVMCKLISVDDRLISNVAYQRYMGMDGGSTYVVQVDGN
jgi:hypothetical protein